jgi:hypothetical protein
MRAPRSLAHVVSVLLTLMVFASAALAQTPSDPGQPYPSGSSPSDQRAGSILFYNLYSSNPTNPAVENTRISITNTHATSSAIVHLFFVEGSSCSPADSYLCLTQNQTATFLASDIDPGVMGFIVAVAVDDQGVPIKFNYLVGSEYVKLSTGHAANLAAEAIGAMMANPAIITEPGKALILFNDWHYTLVPRVLAADNIPSPAEGNSTILIINRFGGDLFDGGRRIGSVFGLLFDDAENVFSFSFSALCQIKQTLSSSFPRTAPVLPSVIPAGRSGWMRFWSTGSVDSTSPGLFGAMINFNPSAGVNANAYNQGHNLHKLVPTAEGYFLPVFPPNC